MFRYLRNFFSWVFRKKATRESLKKNRALLTDLGWKTFGEVNGRCIMCNGTLLDATKPERAALKTGEFVEIRQRAGVVCVVCGITSWDAGNGLSYWSSLNGLLTQEVQNS